MKRFETLPIETQKYFNSIIDLSAKQLVIVTLRYGQRLPARTVAKILNITPERIRQIEGKIIKIVEDNIKVDNNE